MCRGQSGWGLSQERIRLGFRLPRANFRGSRFLVGGRGYLLGDILDGDFAGMLGSRTFDPASLRAEITVK